VRDLKKNGEGEERDLRQLFQVMKALDQARTPDFGAMLRRARAREGTADPAPREAEGWAPGRGGWGRRWERAWGWRRTGWAGGLLAAAAVAGLLLVRSPGTSDAEFERVVRAFTTDPAGGAWRSPTDGLLELPGKKMLSTRPSVGTSGLPGDLAAFPRTIQP